MRTFAVLVALCVLAPACADDDALPIDSSTGSRYSLVEKQGTAQQPELVLKRIRRSGAISYSRNLYDCENRTARQVVSAETLEGLAGKTSTGEMMSVQEGTVAHQLLDYACGR